ncbi:nicotinate-nucleotide adenylyltransferase [Benzoatithermus flavus]|uniref:Probable nicotinate-nucleotide adenylyltransferase n=1 Tax=Benzoatithermus flavus TaxID=3108223 RepID=A0ABU8XM68_9PROT
MTGLSEPRTLRRPVARLTVPPAEAEPPAAPSHRPLRVGLLGGSFNPAHEGHRYVSLEALKRLQLDQVWWLVSPQNPLKPVAGMAPLAERLRAAAAMARHPRIKAMALEARLGTRYTADTLRRLAQWRDHRFVWLMGADNLAQLPRWRHWRAILEACPVAVFERAPYSYRALAGPAAGTLADARLSASRAAELAATDPPAWIFVRLRPHPASATAIRARAKAGGG